VEGQSLAKRSRQTEIFNARQVQGGKELKEVLT
jgi:hypothetical protein